MFQYHCLNPISPVGLGKFPGKYEKTEDLAQADAILVRSADMHSLEISDKTVAVARAGAGVNNIPLEDLAKKGVVVFNTPGANANGVKEMVIAGMLLAKGKKPEKFEEKDAWRKHFSILGYKSVLLLVCIAVLMVAAAADYMIWLIRF